MVQPSTPPIILWLRQDLRLHNNRAFSQACALNLPLLPLYILEDEVSRPMGQASQWWLHHSLAHLGKSLGGLCLHQGNPAAILLKLVQETGAQHLFWNKRYDAPGILKDREIAQQLTQLGVTCHEMPGNLIFEPGAQLNKSGQPFQVFTPYWRHCRQILPLIDSSLTPTTWTIYNQPGQALEDFHLLPHAPNWASGFEDMWVPGEEGALKRLEDFIEHGLKGYALRRNFPSDHGGTSGLSPHLHWGEICVKKVVHTILSACQGRPELGRDAEVYLSELGWREFSYGCLARFPHMATKPLRSAFETFPWAEDNPDHLTAWQKGQTGYPIVDAGMRQLWKTGWMHNRVRMIVASFLTKHLLIPWQKGEQWFWDTLVDADEASNAMGWQWVAGCGMDAAPYFRIFNPVLQGEKFDPEGLYIRHWVPEIASLDKAYIHAPWKASPLILAAEGITLGKTYPYPIVDHATCRNRALEAYGQL